MAEVKQEKVFQNVEEPSTRLILAEYERIAALERTRLELMEGILQTYLVVASAVIVGVLLITEKGAVLGIPYYIADVLLFGLFSFGVLTLFRVVNSNVAVMVLAKRLDILQQFFIDRDSDLPMYLFTGLIEDSERLRHWVSVKGIVMRGLTRGGDKGYLAVVTLFNSLCAGAVIISTLPTWTQLALLSMQSFVIGGAIFLLVVFLHVAYVNYRYDVARRDLESNSLNTFI